MVIAVVLFSLVGVITGLTLRTMTLVRKTVTCSTVPSLVKPRGGPEIGLRAPEIDLLRDNGASPFDVVYSQGRPVLLVFSSHSCPACMSTLGELPRVREQYPDLAVLVVLEGEAHLQRLKSSTQSSDCPEMVVTPIGSFGAFSIRELPTFVFIDGQGIVAATDTGFAPGYLAEWLAREIELLNAPSERRLA